MQADGGGRTDSGRTAAAGRTAAGITRKHIGTTIWVKPMTSHNNLGNRTGTIGNWLSQHKFGTYGHSHGFIFVHINGFATIRVPVRVHLLYKPVIARQKAREPARSNGSIKHAK